MKKIYILGTRGIPACHGGFESFAEKLSLYLIGVGWDVTVYCQSDSGPRISQSTWNGIRLIHIRASDSALGSVLFDLKVAFDAFPRQGLALVLGYNTAVFNILQRGRKKSLLFNMDGLEWKRDKWGVLAKAWFWLNERMGCLLGNHLIADHPEIKAHLETRTSPSKISVIPYGAEDVKSADEARILPFGLRQGCFSIVIARPEPENSILEIVRGFSCKKREHRLVVLGRFAPDSNPYHRAVMDAANDEVIFPGAIYDHDVVGALRFFCRFYIHGHRVGGTNPSLVEALGAGSAVIAHDNKFNRWVAGSGAIFFSEAGDLSEILDLVLEDQSRIEALRASSRQQFLQNFRWQMVLEEYERLLSEWYPLGGT